MLEGLYRSQSALIIKDFMKKNLYKIITLIMVLILASLENSIFSESNMDISNTKIKADCFFCRQKSKGEVIIAKFKHCFVLKDNFPVSKGHLLIVPYEHIENWFVASQVLQHDIIEALNEMKLFLDSEYHPDGYNIGVNCGQAAGQTIMHLHVHLIPRYNGDVDDPRGGVRGVIASKQKY